MTKKQKEAAKKLNPRQKIFAEEYVKTGNIMQSALKAGYKKTTAIAGGRKILESIGVQQYIKILTEKDRKEERKRIADAQEVMEYFTSVMRRELEEEPGVPTPLAESTKAAIELAKRLVDSKPLEARVVIVDDIPKE